MIDKMSTGASRSIGRSIGMGHVDPIRPRDKMTIAGQTGDGPRTNGADVNLKGAIDHMVQQGMPVDRDRIIAIRDAIASGQYPVDPMMIADRMIDFDRPSSAIS